MALPREYGGGGRSAVERLVVSEELLRVGAPVGWHWVADRQSGPSIAAHGTEKQKQYFLPRIARGELCFAIGMSEPEAGSDLAALRSRADRVDGGWIINGRKIWTSGASHATHILGLFRTSPERHGGLTQFIIDPSLNGITISEIPFIDGSTHFCEVLFEDVFVPDQSRLGDVGAGWGQNRAELALERGGVDRWMSMMPALELWVRSPFASSAAARAEVGAVAARCWQFHQFSLAIARMVDEHESPTLEAAIAKEMATRFEQECVEIVVRHFGGAPRIDSADPLEALLARALLVGPSWTIRGGTTEILRNIITKELTHR